MLQLLTPADADAMGELDAFVSRHPRGHFLQSPAWRLVKPGWDWRGIVVREDGAIRASLSVLIRAMPGGFSLLYAPRGPVCDLTDRAALSLLCQGAEQVARQCRGCALLTDPDVPETDVDFLALAGELGFSCRPTDDFDGIQPRFVFRLPLQDRTEEEVFACFASKTRYQVRLARRRGVEIFFYPGDRPIPESALSAFARLMAVTGERDGFLVRDKNYFRRLLSALGERARLYMASLEGAPIAGAVAIQYGNKTWYLYGASSNDHRNAMPNYLLQWEIIRWAIDGGCSLYDFRGVSGNTDPGSPLYGLYRFKKGFGGDFTAFCGTLIRVYRPLAYRCLQAELWGNRALRNRLRPKRGR
ncbi:MAG: peptidoglycan bridge formation glycyltransferase FemA/FemB family protein [Clostridiales bacterium]|nr:peptidoglycan bridge formation glycyltransferase FemA/FemB family protein [Clostridiales bacterium]